MTKLHCLMHVPFEGPGMIADWAQGGGYDLSVTRLYEIASLPELDTFDGLVILGGPMGTKDEQQYPWLLPEKRFIREAITAGKTVLGICLGAQLIAEALGASVYANRHKEIGWFPVDKSPLAEGLPAAAFLPSRLEVFHWHGDTFDLPDGAVRLASSQACLNQGFIYQNRVIALQFHLEITMAGVKRLIQNCNDEITAGPFIQLPPAMLNRPRLLFDQINQIMTDLLNYLFMQR